jgi:hypothetical protein
MRYEAVSFSIRGAEASPVNATEGETFKSYDRLARSFVALGSLSREGEPNQCQALSI